MTGWRAGAGLTTSAGVARESAMKIVTGKATREFTAADLSRIRR